MPETTSSLSPDEGDALTMHSLYSLTPRQQRFCEYYAVDPCGERAAISAGYQPKSARQQSARLLTYDNVQAYLRQLQMPKTKDRILSVTEVRAFWSSVVLDETQKMSDRLQASSFLAKSEGLFLSTIKHDFSSAKSETRIFLPIRDDSDEVPGPNGRNVFLYDPDAPDDSNEYYSL